MKLLSTKKVKLAETTNDNVYADRKRKIAGCEVILFWLHTKNPSFPKRRIKISFKLYNSS